MTGGRRLVRQMKTMHADVRAEVASQIRKTTEKIAHFARILVPVAAVDGGELKSWIRTTYSPRGMLGRVEAGPKGDRKAHAKARSVEYGRKKGNRGKTTAVFYMRRAKSLVSQGFENRIRSAIRKGVKRATSRV